VKHVERIQNALHFIPASPDDCDTWTKMGMVIKSELDDSGFDLWNDWSEPAQSYNENDARDVWRSIKPRGGVTIGTLFHEAKACGWRDDSVYQLPPPESLAERQRVSSGLADKDQEGILMERQEAAAKAEAILKEAAPAKADHPYLVRKQIPAVETLLEIDASAVASILGYSPKSRGDLLTGRLSVVRVEQEGKFSTLELIDPAGRKTVFRGRGTKAGGYWLTDPMAAGDGFFTKAIRDYEAEQAEAEKPVLKRYKADFEAWDAKRSGINDKIRYLAKDNKPTVAME
jgi:putative DNA primase/helicase